MLYLENCLRFANPTEADWRLETRHCFEKTWMLKHLKEWSPLDILNPEVRFWPPFCSLKLLHIETKMRQKRHGKTTCFVNWIFHGSGMILGDWWPGCMLFWGPDLTPNPPKPFLKPLKIDAQIAQDAPKVSPYTGGPEEPNLIPGPCTNFVFR